MSFYDDPNQKDTNPYVREPTRTRESKTFEQEPLTVIDHLDPDKHWIGESLPAAGDDQVSTSGFDNFIGTSPFTARADHRHDYRSTFGFYGVTGPKVCPPGQTFLDNFSFAGGRDMLAPASTQVFVPPFPGNWEWDLSLRVDRVGNFTGECYIVAFFNNGAFNRVIWADSMNTIPGFRVIDCWEHAFSVAAPDPTVNIQFAIQHNDVANYSASIQYLKMKRSEDWQSA